MVVFSFLFFISTEDCLKFEGNPKNRSNPVIHLGSSPLAMSTVHSLFSITVPLNYFPCLTAVKKKKKMIFYSCCCLTVGLLCMCVCVWRIKPFVFYVVVELFPSRTWWTLSSTKCNTRLDQLKRLLDYKKNETKQNVAGDIFLVSFAFLQWDWQGIVMVCYHCYQTWPRQHAGAWCKWRCIGCR